MTDPTPPRNVSVAEAMLQSPWQATDLATCALTLARIVNPAHNPEADANRRDIEAYIDTPIDDLIQGLLEAATLLDIG